MGDRRKCVLLVEDDEVSRYVASKLFAKREWSVRTAATVAEALDTLAGVEPDCLVLDLSLPDGDGETVLREVREAGYGTQVIVCTGTTDSARLDRVRALNPDALLIKPIAWEVVFNLCGGKTA